MGSGLRGSFFNGDVRVTSTAAAVRERRGHLHVCAIRRDASGHVRQWAVGRRIQAGAGRAPTRFRATKAAAAAPRASGNAPSIAGTWIVEREEHQGRDCVAVHRETDRRRRRGDDPPRRRRHRHAHRRLPRREVRAEPFLGRAAAAPRGDARGRRHAAAHAERPDRAHRGEGRCEPCRGHRHADRSGANTRA